ncbi:MAG: molecular chaperone TorD family protein [Burkholderiales bacterium]|nr:molecular chaperone TorD family protein [Burkholderiales bacterium]
MGATDVEKLAARADVARLLSACFYEPGNELGEERVFDALAEAAGRIDTALAADARRLGEAFAASDVQSLLVDYARLFLGPIQPRARPYGSVWLEVDEGLMQESTLGVARLYEEGGFEVAEDFRDLPDHVAAELEFLYLLLFNAAKAAAAGDDAALAPAAALRRRFLAEHLGAWIAPFAQAMRDGAETDFYRALADLAEGFVRREAADASH